MSFRDELYTSAIAPTISTGFIRTFWYVQPANDLYIWDDVLDQYVLFQPDAVIPPQPDASDTVKGIVELATVLEATTGTDTTRAITAAGLKAVRDALHGGAPGALSTLDALAAAINDDPAFFTTVNTALGNKANTDGSNVGTPVLADSDTSLVNTGHLQAVVEDSAASNTNVDDARSLLAVAGATNAAGKQRFVTLPGLDRYVAQKQRDVVGAPGGVTSALLLDDDLIVFDASLGAISFDLVNAALFKKKRYTLVCINLTFPVVVNFVSAAILVGTGNTFTFATVGETLVVQPLNNGTWIRV